MNWNRDPGCVNLNSAVQTQTSPQQNGSLYSCARVYAGTVQVRNVFKAETHTHALESG